MEIIMATWKTIKQHRMSKDVSKKASIDISFMIQWCHIDIFGVHKGTIN
jgi:hypothetical protein